jgi:very-short-patch-repair endonuclease
MEGFTYSEEDLAFDSEFEEVVYDALVERGYSVKTQVGCSGYRIDLAIVDENHPGTYLLGIECDGSQYHASKFARDRDVIRQNILESLGWKIYRIWSNDWMTNRDGILDEIDEIIKEDNQENQITRSVSFSQLEKEKTLHDVDLGARYPKYEDVLPNKKNIKFHDYIYDERIPRSTTLYRHCEESVNAILEKEAPIDKDFLMRKVLSSVGVKRYTERTRKIFDDFLYYYKKNNPIVIEYNTIFTNGVTSLCPVRLSTDDQRPFEYIPMQELAQAVLDFIKPCAAEKENIIREVPNKIYGYNRIGNKIRDRMIATLNYLSSFGYIEDGNGKIKIADDSN